MALTLRVVPVGNLDRDSHVHSALSSLNFGRIKAILAENVERKNWLSQTLPQLSATEVWEVSGLCEPASILSLLSQLEQHFYLLLCSQQSFQVINATVKSLLSHLIVSDEQWGLTVISIHSSNLYEGIISTAAKSTDLLIQTNNLLADSKRAQASFVTRNASTLRELKKCTARLQASAGHSPVDSQTLPQTAELQKCCSKAVHLTTALEAKLQQRRPQAVVTTHVNAFEPRVVSADMVELHGRLASARDCIRFTVTNRTNFRFSKLTLIETSSESVLCTFGLEPAGSQQFSVDTLFEFVNSHNIKLFTFKLAYLSRTVSNKYQHGVAELSFEPGKCALILQNFMVHPLQAIVLLFRETTVLDKAEVQLLAMKRTEVQVNPQLVFEGVSVQLFEGNTPISPQIKLISDSS